MKSIIIGIAGGTGSGKTTLVNRIKEIIGDELVTICHDYYYKANAEVSFEERQALNYDHPNSFDTDQMIQDIKELKQGRCIECPVYDFVNHTRSKKTLHIEPKRVIIVEGILIFENKELLKELDIKVYVDTDADVRIIRRILRDVKERGRTLESVIEQYLGTVKVMHEEFVEPSKRNADIIIPEGGYNEVGLSMLRDKIRMLLAESSYE
jgi:uridine kinase